MPEEIWKIVDGFEMYEVSNLGRFRHRKSKHLLTGKKKQDSGWALYFVLHKDGRRCNLLKKVRAGKLLVARAFINPRLTDAWSIAVIDGNESNLAVDNIRVIDGHEVRSQNTFKTYANGTHPLVRLSPEKVRQIRRLLRVRRTSSIALGEMFGVHPTTINDVKSNRSWSRVS